MLLYACVLMLTVYLLWRNRRSSLGVSAAFLFILLIFHGPALFFFTEYWGGEFQFGQLLHLIDNIDTPELIPKVYLAMSICLASIILGMGMYSYTHPNLKRLMKRNEGLFGYGYKIERVILIAQVSMIFIGFFLLVQFIFVASPLELVRYYFSGIDEFEKVDIRRSATLSFYPYQIFLTAVFPFLSFILIAQAVQDRMTGLNGSRIKKYAILFASTVMLAKMSQYNKSGPVIFLLQIAFTIMYAKTRIFKFRTWHLKLFSFGLLSIIAITALVNSTGSFLLTLLSAFDRTFMIPNEVVFEYFASIPRHLSHGFGTGISWISGFTSANAEEVLGTYWKVGAIVRGSYGSTSNSFFIADAWAEFSWFGIVAFSLFAGWLIRWHDHQVALWGTSPVAIALIVSGYYSAYTLGTTALTTAMLTGGLVLTPLFARVLRLNQSARTRTL